MKFEYSPYIAIPVKDNEKAVDFYNRVLGMDFTALKGNDTYLKTGSMNFVFENNPGSAFREVFFEFKVDSVAEARKLLEGEGCKITALLSEKSMMVADPYGMRFHVFEEGAFPDNP